MVPSRVSGLFLEAEGHSCSAPPTLTEKGFSLRLAQTETDRPNRLDQVSFGAYPGCELACLRNGSAGR